MRDLKTCATCRHLRIVEEGYEVPGLLDTAFLKTRCQLLEWEVKEHYLLPGYDEVKEEKGECIYWEYWEGVEKMPDYG